MLLSLVLAPMLLAAMLFALPSNRWRPKLLPLAALVHVGLVTVVLLPDLGDLGRWLGDTLSIGRQSTGPIELSAFNNWLRLDPLGKVFLGLISLLFFLCSLYAPGYLGQRQERNNRVLCSCMMLSLSMMSLVILSHHLGLMWVAMEATTLASTPGLYFNHNARSLEATWKYLLICSVGIALALLGSLFLAYSSLHAGLESTLLFDDLVGDAGWLSTPWLHAAFVFLLVGYGTKMGLAPMHTWKPDAYGEAPGIVGALLAGGVTNCSFLAILRFYQILVAAGDGDYARGMMLFIGLFSMALAAAFMARQRDFKRMLAYSSVEHMGILIFGIAIGGAAVFGSLLHAINNAMTKGVLFLAAGNIHRAYGSKYRDDVNGAIRKVPFSGALFLAGFLAITGSPPFAPFISEFTILSAAFQSESYFAGGLFLVLLFIVFAGFGANVLSVVFGKPTEPKASAEFRDTPGTVLPILVFLAITLTLGLYLPPWLSEMLRKGANYLEMKR